MIRNRVINIRVFLNEFTKDNIKECKRNRNSSKSLILSKSPHLSQNLKLRLKRTNRLNQIPKNGMKSTMKCQNTLQNTTSFNWLRSVCHVLKTLILTKFRKFKSKFNYLKHRTIRSTTIDAQRCLRTLSQKQNPTQKRVRSAERQRKSLP